MATARRDSILPNLCSRTGSLPRKANERFETPARHVHQWELLLDLARRLDEGDTITVVLLDAGGDRENVAIEDDVFGREADLLRQQLVGAFADRHLALDGVGLALLVERHDHDGRAVAPNLPRVFEELTFAFLHRDRVDDGLALHALEAGLDDAPLGAVDHDRHARDVRLGRDHVEERRHRLLAVEQPFVHVDVDDQRAGSRPAGAPPSAPPDSRSPR